MGRLLHVYFTVNSLQLIKQPKGNCPYLRPTFMVRVMLDSLSEKNQFLTRKMVIFQYLALTFCSPHTSLQYPKKKALYLSRFENGKHFEFVASCHYKLSTHVTTK